ncbi:MAG: peroxidase [Actinomycetota bacterium]|nr:peroxidase [Actinomycetota bacterium]
MTRLIERPAGWLERRFGWNKLPVALGILTLVGVRDRLRAMNLFDTGVPAEGGTPTEALHAYRTTDGRWNDLDHPSMGATGTPFGRNVAPEENQPETEPMLSTPDPRVVSRTLLTRDQFLPATSVNVLAAAWLQFEVHDWFSHAHETTEPYRLPKRDGDPWPREEIVIERTKPTDVPGKFVSEDTHWWDGSQIYGSSEAQRDALRDGARLRIQEGTVPTNAFDFNNRHAGFWAGWGAVHTLFALEHNAIVEHLRHEEKRAWTDDELFETARLVNVALMAKIHTTEWTPAMIAHPTTQRGMRMNWWGICERLKRSRGRITENEVINGIPGTPVDHHGAPYCLTEEFVAVYRMHPLIPDEFVFPGLDGRASLPLGFNQLVTDRAIPLIRELGMATVLRGFGLAYPGAMTLHNFPRVLQEFQRGEDLLDLAAIDIFRNRERGVPRYNRFRQAFHKPPVRSFDELTSHQAWAEEIRQVYGGDIEAVDLMVGLLAETPPQGFAFSDTAFRVFILMASRRLKSDRFFTTHYDAQHYTSSGLRWVDDNGMKTVLLRHYPELAPSLEPIDNAFRPWARVTG